MQTLAELTARYAQPGRLQAIFLRPERLASPVSVESVLVTEAGLEGDHGRPGKRAVTLLQAEHLPVIASLAGRESVAAEDLRRNLLISGLNLSALRSKSIALGEELVLSITGPCAPCSRMEKALGHGAYTAMRGHGGWCATVERPGAISLGDTVRPLGGTPPPDRS